MTCNRGPKCMTWIVAAVAARRARIEWTKTPKTKRADAPTPAREETTE